MKNLIRMLMMEKEIVVYMVMREVEIKREMV